jgi:hypothetical protein
MHYDELDTKTTKLHWNEIKAPLFLTSYLNGYKKAIVSDFTPALKEDGSKSRYF